MTQRARWAPSAAASMGVGLAAHPLYPRAKKGGGAYYCREISDPGT